MTIEGTYSSRMPRVAVATATARFARRRFLFLRAPTEDVDALIDLSASGLKIRSTGERPLSSGAVVDIELLDSSGEPAVSAVAQVKWVDGPFEGEWTAGLMFTHVSKDDQETLQRVIARELGSTVVSDVQTEGYLAIDPTASGVGWVVYGSDRELIARIVESPSVYEITRTDGQQHACERFEDALCWGLGFPKRRLTITPTTRPAPQRP